MEEGEVALFPWPLGLVAVRNEGYGVWRHRCTLLGLA